MFILEYKHIKDYYYINLGVDNVKKTRLFIISLFISILCSSCGTIESLDNYKTITYQLSQEKIAAKDTFVFFGGMEECSACVTFKDTLYEYLKDNLTREVYYMDVTQLSNDELQAQLLITTNFLGQDYYTNTGKNPNVYYTPTIYRYDEGRLVDVHISPMSSVNSILRTNYRELSYAQFTTHSTEVATGYYYFHPALSSEYEVGVVNYLDENTDSIVYSLEWDGMDDTEIAQVYALANIDFASEEDLPSSVILKYVDGVLSNYYVDNEDIATIII